MKRIIILIIAILSLALSACGNSDKYIAQDESIYSTESISDDEQKSSMETATLSEEKVQLLEEEKEDDPLTPHGYPIMSIEEFLNYVSTVELTTDNWRDYIELNNVLIEDTDAFGEVIDSYSILQWDTKKGRAIQNSKNLAFKIKHRSGKYEGTMQARGTSWFLQQGEWFNGLDKEIVADDYNCIEAQGLIYVINIPEDKWLVYNNNPDFRDAESNEKVIKELSTWRYSEADKVIYVGNKNDYCIVNNFGYIWSDKYGALCFEPDGFDYSYYIGNVFNLEESK